jgi:hypothetical protein
MGIFIFQISRLYLSIYEILKFKYQLLLQNRDIQQHNSQKTHLKYNYYNKFSDLIFSVFNPSKLIQL